MNGFWQLALAQLWQVTAVILVVAILVRLFARQRPHLAHALWLVVLLKCVTPPLFSSPSGVFCWLQVSSAESDIAETATDTSQLSASRSGDSIQADSNRWQESSDSKTESLARQLVWQEPIDVEASNESAPWIAQVTEDETHVRATSSPSSINSTAREASEASMDELITHDQDSRLLPKAGNLGLFICWLVGTVTLAAVAALRWCLFLYSLKRKGWCRDESLEALIRKLSRKLGVRRRVRLIVTFGRIGPAVIGILRPTVLLPSVIVEGKSPKELEPILAHELMHFRRGDLWVGMLQVLAQALWWFHPLVWIVNRLVTRDAERCCDEAVIARLDCDPLRYARSLVDVLELKQSLKPVPVVPGVRPVEITSKRLERIMTLGQGSLKRSPWWCWAVMLAATIMLLPGAAFVANAKEKNTNRRSRSRKTLDQHSQQDRRGTTKLEKDKLVTRNYPVGDVFAILQAQHGLKDEHIRELLGQEIMRVAGGHWTKPNGTDVDFDKQGNITITDTTVIPGSATPQLWYKGKTLAVRHTREGHQRISRHLEIERKYGYDEIEIEARLVTVDPKHVNGLGIRWTMLDVDLPQGEVGSQQPSSLWKPLDRPFPEEGAQPQSLARTIVDKNTPVTQATIDNARVKDMISELSGDARINVLTMPKITCFNGRSVTVQDVVQRPFVVSLRRVVSEGKHAYQPRIRVVTEGITMRLRPVLLPDDKVWLDFELTMSEILGVETIQVQTGEKDPPCVQVPEVSRRLINSTLALPPGKSLIIGGLTKKNAKDKPQALLVVLRASKKLPEEKGSTFTPAVAFESNGVKPRIIVQAEDEDNALLGNSSRFSKLTQMAQDWRKAILETGRRRDSDSTDTPLLDPKSPPRKIGDQHSDGTTKNLTRRLSELKWTFGVPAGASIQETDDQYQITASPWRTNYRGDDGRETTMFSADSGNLVVGKGDNLDVTLELQGSVAWQVGEVRAFAERGVWSNSTKQRYALTGRVRFIDIEKQIQLKADKASFDSNRMLLEGKAQVQHVTGGKTDHMSADRIEWHVDKSTFNADGSVSFRTTDDPNKASSARGAEEAASVLSHAGDSESQTGRLMFGVGVNSDAGITGPIVVDENVQPASAEKRIEWVPVANIQQLVEQFNVLMDEQRYAEAEVVALRAKKLKPDDPIVKAMIWKVYFAGRIQSRARSLQTLPSPYYLQDDVQYFPAGPEFKLEKEAAAHRRQEYAKTTISRPIVKKCGRDLIPTDAEVLQALEKQRSIQEGGLALLLEKHAKNFRVVKEKIADYLDPPRASRLVGSVQAHHTHFKCTVYFTETKEVAWPIPHKSSEDIVEVVYLDVVHNHHLEELPHTGDWVQPGKGDSPEEARIKKMLYQKIDVKYSETPLHEFASDIGKRAGVNVYLDRRGLAAKGITKDEPITLKIEQPIQVKSALHLVLSPLNLKFVIEDEVVKITSEQAGNELVSKVYNVADLVVPFPKVVHITSDAQQLQPNEAKPDFNSLIVTIVTTIAPQSWNKAGGPGAIESFETNLSLVISQSKEVHEQIADLLEQMRRLYDVQVTYELRTMTMDQASYEESWDEPLKDKANILSPTEAFFLLQAFNDKEKITVSSGPKFTVFAWQHTIAAVDYHPDRRSSFPEQLHLVPTVSADRRSLNLEWAILADAEKFAKQKSVRNLADGHTLMIDVTDQLSPAKKGDRSDAKQSKLRTIILITPRVIVTEEETEQ